MITNNELQAVKLSPTKQDFYQIWNELLETASKLSERWDPTSTNEADPGIVLLKVLTAIADKLNYKIDKNILEAFMPSATQKEAMMKLCDMMGYSMKYYRSAVTPITISFNGNPEDYENMQLRIDAFTNVKNSDDDINYITLKPVTFGFKPNDELVKTVDAIEGELVDAENGEAITMGYLDDNQRYYLPETQVAENGIFVSTSEEFSKLWGAVDNLNTQPIKTECYKFGFDSKTQAPYIQFPEDIDAIIGNGLYIKYVRTNGANGNISARTLSVMTEPASWETQKAEFSDEQQALFDTSNFSVFNAYASKNGADCETLNQAYNNYKKTIGTFDTLITCRDYMNKIYRMTESENDLTPLVSNIIVSDLRDDINKSSTLCTFDEYGIKYVSQSIKKDNKDLINHFDLVLYPFKVYAGANTRTDYDNSFKISNENKEDIIAQLEKCKTISHVLTMPVSRDIACIKNYLKLSAKISTTYRVNSVEETDILNNIYQAIYNNFNMRNIDFGEEIPFDTIYECIQNADTRIKNVSLNEPEIYTNICYVDGSEDGISDTDATYAHNLLMIKNVIAGRIPLFDYDTSFSYKYDEADYGHFEQTYDNITEIKSEVKVPLTNEKALRANETVLFKRPNLKTELTYPAYVNYYLDLGHEGRPETAATPAVGVRQINLSEDAFYTGTYYTAKRQAAEHGGYHIGYIKGESTTAYYKFTQANDYDSTKATRNEYYILEVEGTDLIPASIKKDSEYQLKAGQFLIINYTPSSSEDSTTTQAAKNIFYTQGTIIRPNFDIEDSKARNESKGFTKKGLEPSTFVNVTEGAGSSASITGSSFNSLANPGMYGLDVDQQIEIRKRNSLTLDSSIFVYWTRLNETAGDDGKIQFEWDENYDSATHKYLSYTLKEGEYFYITDRAKTDIAYYGNGTQLTRMSNVPELKKEEIDDEDLADRVATDGLAAALPWVALNLTASKAITVDEYKYVVLSEGSMLNECVLADETITNLTNNWTTCRTATYTPQDGSETTLETIDVEGMEWQVRSSLQFNVGPNTVQTLHDATDSFTLILNNDEENPVVLTPQTDSAGNAVPLSMKANYSVYSSLDDIKLTGEELEETPFKIKLFKQVDVSNTSGEIVSLNDFGSGIWTKIDHLPASESIKLNVNVPENKLGLIMVYYIDENAAQSSTDDHMTITGESGKVTLSIYNLKDGGTWWSDMTHGKLKIGVNCIQVRGKGYIELTGATAGNGSVIISDLSIANGINPAININTLQNALDLIAKLDPENEFYYNTPIDNSVAIDLNEDTNEKLDSALTWYDPNNICNKFVISEISSKDLKTGIKIATTSKL